MDRYALEHSVVLVRVHLGHALHPGIRGSKIVRESLIKRKSDSRTAEVTDNECYVLIHHVDVVRILRSTWPSNIPDWRRYTLSMTFRLAIGGSGRGLKDTKTK